MNEFSIPTQFDDAPVTSNPPTDISKKEKKVLDTLLSGGKMRGMYAFGRHSPVGAAQFELLTAKQVEAERKRGMAEIRSHTKVPQSVVEKLVLQGFISIPPSEGFQNRIATAKILRKIRSV